MTRKYPEPVTALMTRIIHDNEVLLIRNSTEIQFGDSKELLGIVVMTNPGSFDFKKTPEWDSFKNGEGSVDTFNAVDYPDLSMQNVIQVIRSSYESLGLPKPDGILRVFNLSNIRQPDGQKAETYHNRALNVIPSKLKESLEDPITHSRELFLNECEKAEFVIMGFVDGVFKDKMDQVISWSREIKHSVYAIDDKRRYSHPRRWRTDVKLRNQAIESLKTVLGEG